jgi:hypothetical protein
MGLSALIIATSLAFGAAVGAQSQQLKTLDEIKTWHLPVQGGWMNLKLSSYEDAGRPQDTVLSLEYEDAPFSIKAQEQAELLSRVLREMPALGYKADHLSMISFSSDGTDIEGDANLLVAKSGKWKGCLRRKYCYEAQRIINQFLTTSDAFKEFDTTLSAYGLRRRSVFIDEVVCAPESNAGPRNAPVGSSALSCGGWIFIDLGLVPR